MRALCASALAACASLAFAAEPYTLIRTPPQVQEIDAAPPMEAVAGTNGTASGGLARCQAPIPPLVRRLALQQLGLHTTQPEHAVSTQAYCTPEQRPAVVFVQVIAPTLCGATGTCGAALLRQHEGRWRTLWTGSVPEGEDQMTAPEPDGQGGLRFWFEYADEELRTVREGWRLVPSGMSAAPCPVPSEQVSAKAMPGGGTRLCAPWAGWKQAQTVEFEPTPPDDTGIVPWPPYRLRHATGRFAPPSPGEGAEFIEAFRPLEVVAVCRQSGGTHALLVEQRCEGTGCAPQMRLLQTGAQGWRERWLGDRGWQPLETLLRCAAGEQALNLEAPFRPCACAGLDAASPAVAVAAFEQALRALGPTRPLPLPQDEPLELWLHAEGAEIDTLAAQWDRLWDQAAASGQDAAAPLSRLDDLDVDGYRVQRLGLQQGWESAEWLQVRHPRSGLRAWIKAPLIDSRRGETAFSSETEWTLQSQGVLRVDLSPAAGGGVAQWRIADVIERWGFRRVER